MCTSNFTRPNCKLSPRLHRARHKTRNFRTARTLHWNSQRAWALLRAPENFSEGLRCSQRFWDVLRGSANFSQRVWKFLTGSENFSEGLRISQRAWKVLRGSDNFLRKISGSLRIFQSARELPRYSESCSGSRICQMLWEVLTASDTF